MCIFLLLLGLKDLKTYNDDFVKYSNSANTGLYGIYDL